MAKLTFREDLCKGCGLCVTACPKKILALSKKRMITLTRKIYLTWKVWQSLGLYLFIGYSPFE